MRFTNSHSPPQSAHQARVGALLREWRAARRLSQLDLALDVGTSTRHLSCVETGKAQPSRDMLARLADALGVPLRERNLLLIAAGYAPEYRETALTMPEMAQQRRAIELILEHHEPYPAFVMNRHWDVLMTNRALTRFIDALKPGGAVHSNIVRQVFDPDDLRPFFGNWEEVAQELVRHLHADVATSPSDMKARALLEEVLAYADVPQQWRAREPGATPLPILTTVFRKGDTELRFFSTLTTFATPRDVTLDELRIECMFPADETSAAACRALATGTSGTARDPRSQPPSK